MWLAIQSQPHNGESNASRSYDTSKLLLSLTGRNWALGPVHTQHTQQEMRTVHQSVQLAKQRPDSLATVGASARLAIAHTCPGRLRLKTSKDINSINISIFPLSGRRSHIELFYVCARDQFHAT